MTDTLLELNQETTAQWKPDLGKMWRIYIDIHSIVTAPIEGLNGIDKKY
jgi:hypothetical protein